jgi:uncharacterized protein YjbI with pentapeptide repeats
VDRHGWDAGAPVIEIRHHRTNEVVLRLETATLEGADAGPQKAILRGADLRWAYLKEAALSGADLAGADLRDALHLRTAFLKDSGSPFPK